MIKTLIAFFFFIPSCFAQKKHPIQIIDAGGGVINFTTIVKHAIIKNAIIEANPFIQIFDTTVQLENCKSREFSTAWFGAKSTRVDNYTYLQKAIDVCISNQITNLLVADDYRYSTSLKAYFIYRGNYSGFALNIYGQGEMWSAKTTLTYTGTEGFAFGVQYAKGGSIKKLRIVGNYQPPTYTDSSYFQNPFPVRQNYNGIVIDYDNTKNTGGSSGYTVEDTWVDGFDVLYAISPNGVTFNADMIRFNHVRCGNGRIGFQSNQAQEKGCEINYVSSWDRLETLIQIGKSGKHQAGQYYMTGGNIAGYCVQLFDISLSGWNGFTAEKMSIEGIGRLGTILAWTSVYLPSASLKDLTVRFAFKSSAGTQVLFNANSLNIKISNSNLWYYGQPGQMTYNGSFTFDNVDFGKSTWSNPAIKWQ